MNQYFYSIQNFNFLFRIMYIIFLHATVGIHVHYSVAYVLVGWH